MNNNNNNGNNNNNNNDIFAAWGLNPIFPVIKKVNINNIKRNLTPFVWYILSTDELKDILFGSDIKSELINVYILNYKGERIFTAITELDELKELIEYGVDIDPLMCHIKYLMLNACKEDSDKNPFINTFFTHYIHITDNSDPLDFYSD